MQNTGTKPFRILRVADAAWTDEQVEAYTRYFDDRDASDALLATFATPPTVYWGRPLTISERREVANKATLRDQYEAAFVRGLVKVERLERSDGVVMDYARPDDRSGKAKPIPDADLDLYFDEATVEEIGMVIRNRSFLGRTKGHWYPLPDISLVATLARQRLRAAPTSALSASPGSKAPVAAPSAACTQETPDASQPSPGSVEPTGATATG